MDPNSQPWNPAVTHQDCIFCLPFATEFKVSKLFATILYNIFEAITILELTTNIFHF